MGVGGGAGRPPITRSEIQSPAPRVHMSKCPLSRHWSPNCSKEYHKKNLSIIMKCPDPVPEDKMSTLLKISHNPTHTSPGRQLRIILKMMEVGDRLSFPLAPPSGQTHL